MLDHFVMPAILAMEITSMEQERSEEFYGSADDCPQLKDSYKKVLPVLQMFVCFFLLEIIMNGNCNEQEVSR